MATSVEGDLRLRRDAVIEFQKEQKKGNPKFSVDGEVGQQTRQAVCKQMDGTGTVEEIWRHQFDHRLDQENNRLILEAMVAQGHPD